MCHAARVTHHTSRITHHASRITRHTSRVTRHTSHVTSHTSHVTRHASRITRHASRVTHHASRVTRVCDVRLECQCNACGVKGKGSTCIWAASACGRNCRRRRRRQRRLDTCPEEAPCQMKHALYYTQVTWCNTHMYYTQVTWCITHESHGVINASSIT